MATKRRVEVEVYKILGLKNKVDKSFADYLTNSLT